MINLPIIHRLPYMKRVGFGIIGCGLMGREFASAVARWCHLTDIDLRPEIVAICNRTLSPEKIDWYTDNFPTIEQVTADYRELLSNPDVEAVYVAVPHDQHEEIYRAALESGKHLLGEKPFGIDLKASDAIAASIAAHPDLVVGVASQYIFYPAAQKILTMALEGGFGKIIEIESGFSHSSDLNPMKPINWKRMVGINGEYGCLGDLGVHIALVPIRAGYRPVDTRAILSDIVAERPNADGAMVRCETWDNAVMLSTAKDKSGDSFPWILRVHRIMPGEMNTWYIAIYGTKACARFSLKNPRRLEFLRYQNGEQTWQRMDMGYEVPYKTVSGGIFEFGASDAFMQMMAAFVYELGHEGNPLSEAAACPRPSEMAWCHRLFTAALESHERSATVTI